jgi:hypothetical protein
MQKVCALSAILVFASALAFAETYNGPLVDASCWAQQQKIEMCAPTASTSSFAIQATGKVLKLDAEGNRKAVEALKSNTNSADRAKNPGEPAMAVTATVQGTLSGDEIKVDSIQVH